MCVQYINTLSSLYEYSINRQAGGVDWYVSRTTAVYRRIFDVLFIVGVCRSPLSRITTADDDDDDAAAAAAVPGCGGADLLARKLRLARVHPQQPEARGDAGARAKGDPVHRRLRVADAAPNQLPHLFGSGALAL